jgi:hypothetical protein
MNTMRKKLIFSLTAFTVCLLLCVVNLYWQEGKKEKIHQGELDQYLISKKSLATTFVFEQFGQVVPITELYHPYPEFYAFKELPIDLLRAGYLYAKSCLDQDFEKADRIARGHALSPSKFLVWHQSLCRNNWKALDLWLMRGPYLHPSGNSYIKLLQTQRPELITSELTQYLHVTEKKTYGPFEKFYTSLSKDEQSLYLKNQDKILLADKLIYLSKFDSQHQNIYIFSLELLNKELVNTHSMKISSIEDSPHCINFLNPICLDPSDTLQFRWRSRWNNTVLVYLLIFITLSFLNYVYINKKIADEKNADQALLFQLISHEIRTPMTSLKLNLDSLRSKYEDLAPIAQQSLLQSFDNFQNLEKIVLKALQEIKHDSDRITFNIYNLTDTIIYNNFEEIVEFEPVQESTLVEMSPFWYEICLNNLIKNAINHGARPIKVSLTNKQDHVYLEVQDQGLADLKVLKKMTKPQHKNPLSSGLGIGLSMINRKMKDMGGELIIKVAPTRYILKLKIATKSNTITARES